MRRNLWIAAAFIFVSATFLFAQPILILEGGANYSWGSRDRMKENPVNTNIRVYNAGTDTLNVENPKPTCGCTTAPLDKNRIEPGGYANMGIRLHLNVSGGQYHKTVIINSNDPQTPNITLNLNADVNQNQGYGRIYTRPHQFFSLGMMSQGKSMTDSLTFFNETDKEVTLSNIVIEPKDIKLNIKNNTKIPAGGSIVVQATYKPKTLGEFAGKITMTTSDAEKPTVEVPIWGYIIK